MSPQLLQINYKFNGSRADFEREFGPMASEIARVPGCAGRSGCSTRPNRAAEAATCSTTRSLCTPTSAARWSRP